MKGQKRLRDYGIVIGKMKTGKRNSISDVDGVKVGHFTLKDNNIQTGVTAILPHEGNIFKEKVMAVSHIINGFGKTMGTIQIEELGTIETPIILTNTLGIGTAADALIEYMLEQNEDIGNTTGTINPVVCECNDQYLNDIRGKHIKKQNIVEAIKNASVDFEEGAVGAGRGMSCMGFKGGIGTSSRIFELGEETFTIGALVMSNFGAKENLIIDGIKIGKLIEELDNNKYPGEDKGSIIIILATDIPLTVRQLKRIAKRAVVGLSRTGSYIGNGSGDVVIGFSTVNRINHYETRATIPIKMFNENKMDIAFRATAEAVEEAILNSMVCAETTIGKNGNRRDSLGEFMDKGPYKDPSLRSV